MITLSVTVNNFSVMSGQFPVGFVWFDHLCSIWLVFVMLSRLFIAALWSGKGLTYWLLFVMFNCVFLSLSHVVSWVRCGT